MIVIADNRKAYFNYFVIEEFNAGIVLMGSEVKSLRQRRVSLSDSHVIEKNMELWLCNMHISEYKHSMTNHAPKRQRKLLCNRKEINKIAGKIKERGLTVVPLLVYFNEKGLFKVKLAVVKGKKLYDKREEIKKREIDITRRRALKGDFSN